MEGRETTRRDGRQGRTRPVAATMANPRRAHLLALLVLLASVVTVLALWRSTYVREVRTAEARFVAQTADVANRIEQRLGHYELLAGGGLSLFSSVRSEERRVGKEWRSRGRSYPQNKNERRRTKCLHAT